MLGTSVSPRAGVDLGAAEPESGIGNELNLDHIHPAVEKLSVAPGTDTDCGVSPRLTTPFHKFRQRILL